MKTPRFVFILAIILLPAWGFSFFDFFSSAHKDPKKEINQILRNRIDLVRPSDTLISWAPIGLLPGHRLRFQLELSLWYPKVMTTDPDEAEKVLIDILKKAGAVINTTPEVRPYLPTFPLSSDELAIYLTLGFQKDTPFNRPFKPYITYVKFDDGCIRVFYKLPIDSFRQNDFTYQNDTEEIRARSYPNLLEDLAEKCLPQVGDKKEVIIEQGTYNNHPCDTPKTWEAFAFKFAQKNGTIFISDNDVRKEATLSERNKVYLSMWYCSQEKRVTLEEAKKLIREASKTHLDFFSKDPTGILQVKIDQKRDQIKEDGIPKLENLSLRFDFWDKYIDRIKPPHLAQIHMIGRTVYYYTSDEHERLVLLEKEELPEASSNLSSDKKA